MASVGPGFYVIFFLGEIPRTIVAREEIFEFAATAPGD
jgi:hypothetical protein